MTHDNRKEWLDKGRSWENWVAGEKTYSVEPTTNSPDYYRIPDEEECTSTIAPTTTTITYPSTTTTANHIWSTSGYSKTVINEYMVPPTRKLTQEEFDQVVNYETPEDLVKAEIFVPGRLYRFNHKECSYTMLLPADVTSLASLVLSDGDVHSYQDKIFLCLESVLLDGTGTAVTRKGKTKVVDRMWKTSFLVDEKVWTFTWYENAGAVRTTKGANIDSIAERYLYPSHKYPPAPPYTYTCYPQTNMPNPWSTITGGTTPPQQLQQHTMTLKKKPLDGVSYPCPDVFIELVEEDEDILR